MSTAYLSLGSNLGDRLEFLAGAVRLLESSRTWVQRVSSVYETLPQGKTDQPNFLNIALEVETDLEPAALLSQIQEVERALGRVRTERWGPRTVDIDIVLFGDLVVSEPGLELPHPRLTERVFVLMPLLELNPDLSLPATGELLRLSLERLPDQGVSRFLRAEAFLRCLKGGP